MAGLEVLRLVNEPTAAALAYGLDRANEGTIAVYDLGGGTFDISILKLRDGIFEVQSTNGDTHLGGDDIDNLLTAIALDEIYAEHGVDLRGHPSAVQALRKAAIEAKISLSTEDVAKFDIELRCWSARPALASRLSPMRALRPSRLTKLCWWVAPRASPPCVSLLTISSTFPPAARSRTSN
jgi:molecular chaperone DnaK (HSP70)